MVSYTTGSDYSGSSFLNEPGKYHMVVQDMVWPFIEDGCTSEKTLCQITVSVAAGPAGTKGKTKKFKFAKPQPDDNTDFKQKRIDRLLLACGFVKPENKNAAVEFECEDWRTQQFCVNLVNEKNELTGKEYLNINFSDIFHVDDPEASSYPKDEKILTLIPADRRWGKSNEKPASEASSF